MNGIPRQVAEACAKNPLDRKWLVAPSLRVGHQWILQAVGERGLFDIEPRTMAGVATELAAPAMAAAGLAGVSTRAGTMLIDSILARLRGKGESYLLSLPASLAISRTVYGSIQALRLAGLGPEDLAKGRYESSIKGKELATILKEYIRELQTRKLVDFAEILKIARQALSDRKRSTMPILLFPEDLRLSRLELWLRESYDPSRVALLVPDEPASPGGDREQTNLRLLSYVQEPQKAPGPMKDQSVTMFRAIGEVNEVRQVLRDCLSGGFSLDDVEVLCTDPTTYVPLLYELLLGLYGMEAGQDLPATFAEGIPIRYSRPARALAAWLRWTQQGYPQAILVRMIQDGLVELEGDRSFSQVAGLLRSIPIGFGRDRYPRLVEEQAKACRAQLEKGRLVDEDGEEEPERLKDASRQLKELEALQQLLKQLLSACPPDDADQKTILASAGRFLEKCGRRVNQLDHMSAGQILEDIVEMASLVQEKDSEGLDARLYLDDILREGRVGASGPQPGKLHVALMAAGGHSGRSHTFILGLNDQRFPIVGIQDPVLLDTERQSLSKDLLTTADRLDDAIGGFARLLSRLRGKLTLSFPCWDLVDDRELFPASVLVTVYRLLTGDTAADQGRLLALLGQPVSFVPDRVDQALDMSEWWACRVVDRPRAEVGSALDFYLPHLARGQVAMARRATSDFTEFDGLVPVAGADCDPAAPQAPVLSASRLEMAGKCPRRYFLRYCLGLKKPPDTEVDRTIWLDSRQNGSLLHEVFCTFMKNSINLDLVPVNFDRDRSRLVSILGKTVERYYLLVPVPGEAARLERLRQLEQACLIFLREEEIYQQDHKPLYLESSVGMPPEGDACPMDSTDPVSIRLSKGREIRIRGRLDRVDQDADGRFLVWDYKTGSSWIYQQSPPFWEGRILQHYLYMEIARRRLGQIHNNAQIVTSGYFLPGHEAMGERFAYTAEQLAEGSKILGRLCDVLTAGLFAPTTAGGDCKFCDYVEVCGDADATASRAEAKLKANATGVLGPFAELRPSAIEQEGEE